MMGVKKVRSRTGHRGIAVITVIGLLLVLLVFAGGMMTQLAMELTSVKQHGVSNTALAAADAGIHGMVAAIQNAAINNVAPPSGPLVYNYPEAVGPSKVSYSATLDQTWVDGGLTYYLITSTGTVNAKPLGSARIIRAIVRSQPYARYASFSIYEVNRWGNPVWYRFDQNFGGPVYSGGPMRIAYQDGVGPIFSNGVTTLNTPVWAPGKPSTAADWTAVSNGSGNFVINSTPLSLPQPSSNVVVASEAWEGDGSNTFSGGYPAVPPGLYINGKNAASGGGGVMNTGIFINVGGKGNKVLVDSKVVGNTETMTFRSGVAGFGAAYTVTINFNPVNPNLGTTTVTQGSNTATFSGIPSGVPGPGNPNTGNGAIFANGNIVFGSANPDVTLKGSLTFATPDYSGDTESIILNGNLRYDNPVIDKTALWANDVIMNTWLSNITVDASIIAGYPGEKWNDGNFSNAHCGQTSCGGLNQGNLTINGGLIENDRGAVGLWVGPTHTGFSRVINYDPRLAANPPPFNPTTGAFNIIAWDDEGS